MDDSKKDEVGVASNESHDVEEDLSQLEEIVVGLGRDFESKFAEAARLASTHDDAIAPVILEELMDSVFDSFRPAVPYDRIGLAFVDDDRTSIRTRWVRSDLPKIKLDVGYSESLLESRLQEILDSGEPRLLNDLNAHLKKNPRSRSTRLLVDEGNRSSLTYPLVIKEKPVGLIFFSSAKTNAYSDDHREALERCGGRLARLIEKSRLYENLVELNWQLGVARDALAYQSTHDALTRLWSRPAILDIVQRELDRSRRENKSIAVMIVDIDRFREINVAYGQEGGDAVLSGVARRLSGSLRSYEEVGRYSGAEFLLALYACDERGAENVSQRLRTLVSSVAVETPMGEIPVTISLGSAVMSAGNGADLDVLISAAEKALQKAKKDAPGSSVIVNV